MVWALIASLAIVFNSGAAPLKIRVSPAPIAQSQSAYDQEAERQLLDLANRARAQSGLPPLHEDEGLKSAARAHAELMAGQRQLSHRFAGEEALAQRLASDSDLHLDQSGENVAYAGSADQAHDSLMKSPAHRENLLSPDYNTAGFGAVRRGNLLYITQDFAHSLPKLSAQTAEETVAARLNRERSQMGLPPLQRVDGGSAHATACSMAQASLLKTSGTQARYVLRYTSMEPSSLPAGTERATRDRDLRAFSVGACYARSAAYPTGAYWVIVQFF